MRDPLVKRYGDAIQMWASGFNTAEIAEHLKLPEHEVERWVHNYSDATHRIDQRIQAGAYDA